MPLGGGELGSGIGGAVGGVVGLLTAGKGGEEDLKRAAQLWKDLQTSDFDFRELSPPQLRLLATATPELFQSYAPEEFQQIADSPEARAGQVRALGQMQEYAETGEPLVDRLNRQAAARNVQDASAGARAAALRNLAARGNLGAGDEIQASLAGSAQASNLGRDLASEAAREAALRRMGAVGQAGQMAGQLRGADVELAGRNADISNRYKELFANTMNQANMYNAGARERAAAYNVGQTQRLGDTNEQARYETALENLNRKNRLKGDIFQQQLAKTQGLADVYGQLSDAKYAERAARIGNAQSIGSGVGGAAGSAFSFGG